MTPRGKFPIPLGMSRPKRRPNPLFGAEGVLLAVAIAMLVILFGVATAGGGILFLAAAVLAFWIAWRALKLLFRGGLYAILAKPA